MLEILIMFCPAVFAVLAYRFVHTEIQLKKNWKRIAAVIILYTLVTDLLILFGVHAIGIKDFCLFETPVRFKLKWLGLQLGLGIIFTAAYRNIYGIWQQKLSVKRQLKRMIPAVLFLDVTYAVFTPSSLFLSNMEEFSVSYLKILPVLLTVALLLTAGVFLAAICFTNEKNVIYFAALLFAVAFGLYVQGNFLNPDLPSLDGTAIVWSDYVTEERISAAFWCVCILGILTAAVWRKDKTEKVIRYASYFLSLVQILSLAVLILTHPQDKSVDYGMLKDGQFSVGTKENIILFIVDTLQADTLREYLDSDAYVDGSLDGFTFFDDAVSGGAPTQVALPVLLTGFEYDPRQPLDEYREEAWRETTLYDDMHENGYDVRMYTIRQDVEGCNEKVIDNYGVIGSHWIENYPEFGRQLYKLVSFNLFPQTFKKYFWLSTDAISDTIETSNTGYRIDDLKFHRTLEELDAITTDYEKAFRMYHLRGVHEPCYINADFEYVEGEGVNLPQQETLQAIMGLLNTYLDDLKAAGVYDESMVIILGDHGRHEKGNVESNPAVLIKRPGESHALVYDSSPIHFRNIVATMASNIMEDYTKYGPGVYDIDENSDVERMHTIDEMIRSRNVFSEQIDSSLDYTRIIVSGKANGGEYHVYDPASLNCISYKMGETLDFETDNAYAKQADYRLYREDGAAVASNELNICFDLSEAEVKKRKDYIFHFVCSDVYNDTQLMRIYAGGKKVGTITCTKAECGTEQTVTISAENLKDGKLSIRMVFPGAVTPRQLDPESNDTRVLSVAFQSMWLTQ